MDTEWDSQYDEQFGAEDRERENLALFKRREAVSAHVQGLRERSTRGLSTEAEAEQLRRSERELENIVFEIFSLNMGLVRAYVARFTAKSSSLAEDLESAGRVGLMQAIQTFRPGRGGFGTWAYKPIKREILQAVRQADHQHLNASDFDRRPAVLRAAEAYATAHPAGAPRDFGAIAKSAGSTVNQARRILNAVRLESLNAPSSGLDNGTLAERIGDHGPTVEDQALLALDIRSLWHGIDLLDVREIYVLTRRFGLDGEAEQTLEAIGGTLGLSREAVRQIQVKALTKLSADSGLPGRQVPASPRPISAGQPVVLPPVDETVPTADLTPDPRGADAATGPHVSQDPPPAVLEPDTVPGQSDQASGCGADACAQAVGELESHPGGNDAAQLEPGPADRDASGACCSHLQHHHPGGSRPAVRVRLTRYHFPPGTIDMEETAGPSPPSETMEAPAPSALATGRADGR